MSSTNNVISTGSGNATTTNLSASQSAITLSNSTPSPATSTPQIPPVSAPPKAKRRRRVTGPRKCRLCGLPGHNRRTCKKKVSLVPQHLKPSVTPATPAVAPVNPSAPSAAPAVVTTRPSSFPAKVGDYFLFIPVSIDDLSVGDKVRATYKGSIVKYRATISAVDRDAGTIDLKYDDGDVWNKALWFKPFCDTSKLSQISALYDSKNKIEVKTPTGTKVVPLDKWYNHIIPYKVEIKRNNKWERMGNDISFLLVRSHALQKSTGQFSIGSHKCIVSWDFKNGKLLSTGMQTNMVTRTQRQVRLVRFSAPKKRQPLFDSKYPIVKLSELPSKYSKILSSIREEYRVYDLKALEHKELLDFKISHEKKQGNNAQTELLFHGTSVSTMKKMINSEVGFQKVRTKNGKAYGDGIYLTNNLSYSREYADLDSSGSRVILLCDVLVGKRMKTDSSHTMLKPGFRTGGNGYDIYMKPWVFATDIAFMYVVEILKP